MQEFSIGNEGRQVYWNAESFGLLFYPLAVLAMAIFAYGVYRRWRLWTALGKSEKRNDRIGERIKLLGTQSSTSREGIEKLLARYPAGTKVPVHYDPLDPSRAVLETGYSWGSILFLALGLCGAAIFVLVLLRRQS